jgi:hypothetical protein
MERNPYAPPKAKLTEGEGDGSPLPGFPVESRPFTPRQHFVASFLGAPIAAAWLAAHNYRALARPQDARQVVIWGIVATLVVFGIALVLPEDFPNAVLPLAYCVAVLTLAKQRFGDLVDAHSAAGGGTASWWRVVGIGLLSLIVVGLILTALVFALVYAGVVE